MEDVLPEEASAAAAHVVGCCRRCWPCCGLPKRTSPAPRLTLLPPRPPLRLLQRHAAPRDEGGGFTLGRNSCPSSCTRLHTLTRALHCCLHRCLPPQTLRFGGWQRVPAGKPIMPGNEVHTRFFVLVEGLASLRHVVDGVEAEPYLQFSGCCFDLEASCRAEGGAGPEGERERERGMGLHAGDAGATGIRHRLLRLHAGAT